MDTTKLREALLKAPVHRLGDVIDWLQRPWAPGSNDALRAAWHEARRRPEATPALAYAIEHEVRSLATTADPRDVRLVASRLGFDSPTPAVIVREIAVRLGGAATVTAFSPDTLATAIRVAAEVARVFLDGRQGRREHRRHRYGRG